MELESLKELWNQPVPPDKEVSGEDIQQMMQRRSKSAIAKMKRNLKIELGLLLLVYAYVVISYVKTMPGTVWLLLGVELIYLIYFGVKYRLLSRMECHACEVRSNLSRQLRSLESLLRFYLWSGILLIPLTALCSFWIGYSYTSLPDNPENPVPLPIVYLILFVISLLLCIPLFFVSKWYIRKLYGRHIDKLKEMMNELKDDETVNS